MKCKHCNSEDIVADIKVDMRISVEDIYRLTKGTVRKKTTEIRAVNWDRTTFICRCCGTMLAVNDLV